MPLSPYRIIIISSMQFEIVTYNILTDKYCTADTYCHTEEEALDFDKRWGLLKEKLGEKITSQAVICLQEVSHAWLHKLLPYFSSNGYFCVYDNYGNFYNGWMGVMIAVPMFKYKIIETKIVNIGHELSKVSQRIERRALMPYVPKVVSNIIKYFAVGCDRAIKHLRPSSSSSSSTPDDWGYAIGKNNSLLCVILQNAGKAVCIGTYHMPCSYKTTTSSAAHSAMLFQQLSRLAGDIPFLLVGDFNLKPDSPIYERLMAKGVRTLGDLIDIPDKYLVNEWLPSINVNISSAYKTVNGTEPVYTTNCHVKDSEQFTGTLDYIFYSEGSENGEKMLEPLSVDALPDDTSICYPNSTEPSDHLMIGATFKLL